MYVIASNRSHIVSLDFSGDPQSLQNAYFIYIYTKALNKCHGRGQRRVHTTRTSQLFYKNHKCFAVFSWLIPSYIVVSKGLDRLGVMCVNVSGGKSTSVACVRHKKWATRLREEFVPRATCRSDHLRTVGRCTPFTRRLQRSTNRINLSLWILMRTV